MTQKKWFKDGPGEGPKTNWFKEHPLTTMGMLLAAVVVITWLSII